jgi:hypothetical protein
MNQFAILFNPFARVYNLRMLLLLNIVTVVYTVYKLKTVDNVAFAVILCSIEICFHHILR